MKAKYTQLSADSIQVTNTGFNRETKQIQGVVGSAKVDDEKSALTVTFGAPSSALLQSLAGPNYKIQNIWLDDKGNYERVVVVDSFAGIEFIWILARKPVISTAELAQSLDYVKAAGYHPEMQGFQLTECTDTEREALPAAAR